MKEYDFKFESRPAEFSHGRVSVSFVLFAHDPNHHVEKATMTWPAAKVYFADFIAKAVGPVACYIRCTSPSMPPGFKTFNDTV